MIDYFPFIILFVTSMIIGKHFNIKMPSIILYALVILLIFTVSLWGGASINAEQFTYLLFISVLVSAGLDVLTYLSGFFFSIKGKSKWKKMDFKSQLKYVIPFIVGLGIGMAFGDFSSDILLTAITYELIALVVIAGLLIGKEIKTETIKKAFNLTLFSVIADIVGAVLLSAVLSSFFPFKETLIVMLGSGWVTYTAPFVASTYGNVAGIFAFLVNFFRVELAFVLLPLLSRKRIFPAGAIAVGGTASMDVVLPLYIELLGDDYAVGAISSGVVLSVLVPIILPLIALL